MGQRIRRVLGGKHAGRLLLVAGGVAFVLVVGAIGSFAIIAGMANITSARPTPITPVKVPPTTMVKVPTATTAVVTPTPSPQPTKQLSKMIPVQVRVYTIEGSMADGTWTHVGACAVATTQFPLGTILYLYNADGSFNRACLAEDTGSDIQYGQIDLAMPGDADGASRWGIQNLWARVVRWGWSEGGSPTAFPTP